MTKNLGKPGGPDGPPIDSKGVDFSDLGTGQKFIAVGAMLALVSTAIVAFLIVLGAASWLALRIWESVFGNLTI